MTKNRTIVLFVALLVLLAFTLRLPRLQQKPIDVDEVYSYLAAKGTAEHGVPLLPAGQQYLRGILASYLNAGAILLLGDSVQSLRFVSLLFSLLLIVLGFLIATHLFDRTTGLITATLLALLPIQHFYAVNGRMYMQLQFLFLLTAFLLYLGYAKDQVRHKYLALLPFVGGLLTHTLAVMAMPGLLVYLLLAKPLSYFFRRHNFASLALFFLTSMASVVYAKMAHNPIQGYSWDLTTAFSLSHFRPFSLLALISHEAPLLATLLILGATLLLIEKNGPLRFFYLMALVSTLLTNLYVNQTMVRYYYEIVPLYLMISSYVLARTPGLVMSYVSKPSAALAQAREPIQASHVHEI
jgi:4-amino-4-deoxy-L-arabinose transferase-like glycosyltransferase